MDDHTPYTIFGPWHIWLCVKIWHPQIWIWFPAIFICVDGYRWAGSHVFFFSKITFFSNYFPTIFQLFSNYFPTIFQLSWLISYIFFFRNIFFSHLFSPIFFDSSGDRRSGDHRFLGRDPPWAHRTAEQLLVSQDRSWCPRLFLHCYHLRFKDTRRGDQFSGDLGISFVEV